MLTPRGKRYLKISLAGLAGLIILTVGSVVYTSKSSFCISCHYMEPFYESWKSSKHNEVECIECHFPPGIENKIRGKMEGLVQLVKYVSHSYKKSKPWAEIPDESCLRSGCHEIRVLNGEAKLEAKLVKPEEGEAKPEEGDAKLEAKLEESDAKPKEGDVKLDVKLVTLVKLDTKLDTKLDVKLEEGDAKLEEGDAKLEAKLKELDIKLKKGEIWFKRSVVFSHKPHLTGMRRGKELRCTSCHSQVVQGDHISVNESTCFICHFKKPLSGIKKAVYTPEEMKTTEKVSECTTCHTRETLVKMSRAGLLRYDHSLIIEVSYDCKNCHTQVVTGNALVNKQKCASCHWQTEILEKFKDTDMMHREHISERKVECLSCHMAIEHKITHKSVENIADCLSCHEERHLAESQLFLGVGGYDAKSRPNKMAEIGMSCRGCHIFHEIKLKENGEETITPFLAKYESCDKCHGKGYGKILTHWKETTAKNLKLLDGIYINVGQEVEKTDEMMNMSVEKFRIGDTVLKKKEKARIIMDDALANMAIVRKGKSVHNIQYAMELLNVSYGKFEDALDLIGSKYKLPFFELGQPEPFAECLICHKGIKKYDPDFAGLTFSHKNHLEGKKYVEYIEEDLEEDLDEDLDENLDEDLDEDLDEEEEEPQGRKLTCERCHSNVKKHGELVILKSKCAVCHHDPDREIEKKCEDCHILQRDIVMGKWEFVSEQAEMSSDAKKKGIAKKDTGCKDCHDRIAEGKPIEQKVCVDCHKEPEAEKYYEWRNFAKKMIADMTQTIDRLKINGIDEADRPEFERLERFTKGFIDDGSLSIHNPAIHEAAKKVKRELDNLVRITLPFPYEKVTKSVYRF